MKLRLAAICGLATAFHASTAHATAVVVPEPGPATLIGTIAVGAVLLARLRRGR